MKMTVEIDGAADREAVRQAIRMVTGVLGAQDYQKPPGEAENDSLRDELELAHNVLFEIGQQIYRHADTSNPCCPLAQLHDKAESYLSKHMSERVDMVVKTPGDIMFLSVEA